MNFFALDTTRQTKSQQMMLKFFRSNFCFLRHSSSFVTCFFIENCACDIFSYNKKANCVDILPICICCISLFTL